MVAGATLPEYLDEIRREVCSRCVERPTGGPPCLPLGKPCGVELHLPQLVQAVGEVRSELIAPYLDHTRKDICTKCPYLHGEFCPCPMDSLGVLVVEAIEAVDERHARREPRSPTDRAAVTRPDLAEIAGVFEAAAGTWTGCDWSTWFGPSGMNLQGCRAAVAEARALKAVDKAEREDGTAATEWLREIERRAEMAEKEAKLAVAAANAETWREARNHARRAWSLEFHTGRPFRRQPPTWQRLYEVIEAMAAAHGAVELDILS
jgi:hypothetical protein